jgi:hypothetical protein
LFKPSPAANTIRGRKASCWPVVKALQLRAFPLTQHHFRRSRCGHRPFRSNQDASSYPAVETVPAPFRLPVLGCYDRPQRRPSGDFSMRPPGEA